MLKDLRLDRGMTQTALAEKSGVCVTQIRKIESGTISPENLTLRNAKRLADALNAKIEELIQ